MFIEYQPSAYINMDLVHAKRESTWVHFFGYDYEVKLDTASEAEADKLLKAIMSLYDNGRKCVTYESLYRICKFAKK